jgi:hypothetical protein
MLFHFSKINVVHINVLDGLVEGEGLSEDNRNEKKRSGNTLGIGEGAENLELDDLFQFEVAEHFAVALRFDDLWPTRLWHHYHDYLLI